MEFRVLGPLELWSDGQRRPLGWARERHVLAILLMTPGRPVPTETLIERVWDADPPDRARDLLYPHVTRLRGFLQDLGEEVRLDSRSGNYLLEVDPLLIDYHVFRDLRNQARAIAESGETEYALRLLRQARALWRGEPLKGVHGTWAAQRREGIREELLAGTRERLELELAHANHDDATAELSELLGQFPYDEKLAELLMLALHRGGRSGEALQVHDRFRRRLAADVGTSPRTELRELHRRILADDPALKIRAGTRRGTPPPGGLPPDVHTFTGREAELDRLRALVLGEGPGVTVVAVDGMPGVGKTTLAVHLAHALAPDFPDGQIFVELRAHDPRQAPANPAVVLERLLRSLGVPERHVPKDLDGRAALWRTELARRRLLLVLDDALDNEQVRPLLPGTSGCAVLLTSRRRLAGLDTARPLPLDVLAPEDSARLLARAAGRGISPDAPGIDTVAHLCGHLPLAIQLVGNRLRHRTSWTPVDLAARLGEGRRRLEQMRAENREVAAAFGLSVQGLDESRRRAFLLLGLHPGADLTAGSAAALLGLEEDRAEHLLDDLLDHNLIAEPRQGRFRLHDLVREYARARAVQEPSLDLDARLERVLEHYLITAGQADRIMFPQVPTRIRPAEPATAPVSASGDEEQARAWLDHELENLVRVAHFAVDEGRPRKAGLLARALVRHLETAGLWYDAAELHTCAVAAWRADGDRHGLARALLDLSKVRWRVGRHEEALGWAVEALEIGRSLQDDAIVASSLDQIGLIHWTRSEFDVAFGYFDQALGAWRAIGDRWGEAEALNHLAIVLWHQGRYPEAVARLRAALILHEDLDDPRGRQMTLNNAGDVERGLGRYDSALRYYEQARDVLEMSRQHEAVWRNNVASVHQETGRPADAIKEYRRAVAIYREIGDLRGEADSLNNIGMCYAYMSRDGEAIIHHQKALQISQDLSERYEQAIALRNIAEVHRRAGRYGVAIENFERSLALARAIGDAHQEALVTDGMAAAIAQTRGAAQAEPHWRRALELYEELGLAEADVVRARLLGPSDASG
jgi:tetratricopeptide (TPR) repeat protein/DNA-binding SARP family transcriptional activator